MKLYIKHPINKGEIDMLIFATRGDACTWPLNLRGSHLNLAVVTPTILCSCVVDCSKMGNIFCKSYQYNH